jgi:hypothetical protein
LLFRTLAIFLVSIIHILHWLFSIALDLALIQ